MLKFTIIIVFLVISMDSKMEINATIPMKENDLRNQLRFMITEIKNHEMQKIRTLVISNTDEFIARINELIEKSWNEIEISNKKYGNANNPICDKLKDNITDIIIVSIENFESCILKVINTTDTDLDFLILDESILKKEIQSINDFNKIKEEMIRKVANLEAGSSQFAQYKMKLKNCKTQLNLLQLNQRISEILSSYKLCLQDIKINNDP